MQSEYAAELRRLAGWLAKKQVEIADYFGAYLRCKNCGIEWYTNTPPAGKRMVNGYWKCPHCYGEV